MGAVLPAVGGQIAQCARRGAEFGGSGATFQRVADTHQIALHLYDSRDGFPLVDPDFPRHRYMVVLCRRGNFMNAVIGGFTAESYGISRSGKFQFHLFGGVGGHRLTTKLGAHDLPPPFNCTDLINGHFSCVW